MIGVARNPSGPAPEASGREKYPDSTKITGIVVCYNETKLLRRCLWGLRFCDHRIVVDLGSTDGSAETARAEGAEVLYHPWVPIGEEVREFSAERARTDWVIFLDPDEVVPDCLAPQIRRAILEIQDLAILRVPIQFYFKGKPLTYCVWGRPDLPKTLLYHKNRVHFTRLVHTKTEPLPGFKEALLPRQGDCAVSHYWAESYRQLLEKHRRYIGLEGESRYLKGQRFSWTRMLLDTAWALKTNLFDYRGLVAGLTGISLSFFYAWYVLMGWRSLRRYEKGLPRGS